MQEPESSPAALEEGPTLLPWYTGQSKRREEKSQQVHQERVQRYHQIHDLYAKQVDVANIARQVGLSPLSLTVFNTARKVHVPGKRKRSSLA